MDRGVRDWARCAAAGAPGVWETEPVRLHRVVSAIERVAVPAGARLSLNDQSLCAGSVLSALEAADIEASNPWIFVPDNGMPSERLPAPADGAEALDAWLATPAAERPTAIVAANDVIATGLMCGAARHGIVLPSDLSLIGFDNDPGAMLAGLTTIERPTVALGEATARTTLEQIAAGPETSSVTLRLRPVIIERATVAAISAAERTT